MKGFLALLLVALPLLGAFADTDPAAVSQRLIGIQAGLSAASDSVSALQASVNAASVDSSNDSGSDLSAISQLLNDIAGDIETGLEYVSDVLSLVNHMEGKQTSILYEVLNISSVCNTLESMVIAINESISTVNKSIVSFQDNFNAVMGAYLPYFEMYLMNLPDIYSKCEELVNEAQTLYVRVSSIEDILNEIKDRMDGTFTVDFEDDGTATKAANQMNSALADIKKALADLQIYIEQNGVQNVEIGDITSQLGLVSDSMANTESILKSWRSMWYDEFYYNWWYLFTNYFINEWNMPNLMSFYYKWMQASTDENGSFMPVVRLGYNSSSISGVKIDYLDYLNYRLNTGQGETNIAEVVSFQLDDSTDFFAACAKLLVGSVQVASANGKTAYEILQVLRSSDIPGVAEEDKPDLLDDMTKIEDEYQDDDGWRGRFGGITNTLSDIKSDVQGEDVVNNLFGSLNSSAPSSLSFRFPEYDWSFSGFEIHTESNVVSSEIDGGVSQFFENCRAVAVFAWWVVAVLVHFFFLWLFVRLFKSNVVDRLDSILGGGK